MMLKPLVPLFAVALLACEPPEATPDAGQTPADPMPDGGPPLDAGREAELSWGLASVKLPAPRDHHATVVSGSFIYVVGGTDSWDVIGDEIFRFEIDSDGALRPAVKVGRLPQPRAGHTAVVLEKKLVVTGGLTQVPAGRYMLDSTIWAEIDGDGGLGPWTAGPALPMPVMHHGCDVVGRRMHCFGGRITGNFTGTLAVSTGVTSTGGLENFEASSALPHSLGFQQSFVSRDALYLVGGLQRDAPMATFIRPTRALRAKALDDGRLGQWEEAGGLPESIHVGAASVFRDRVYVVGGIDEHDRTINTVFSSALDDQTPLLFSSNQATPAVARAHVHQLASAGARVYLIGGRLESNRSTDSIEVGTFE